MIPRYILPLLCCTLAYSSAIAGGVRSMRISEIPYAARPVVVDGNLKEWQGTEGVNYQPFEASLTTDANLAVRKLQAYPSSVKVFFSYDTEALYVAINWKGSHPAKNPADVLAASTWWKSGDGIELHLFTDRSVHVASWPINGSTSATAIRVGDQGEWKKASDSGITSAVVPNLARNGYTEEIRIPWSAVTTTGKIPADGSLKVACDIVWSDLNPELIQKLPQELHANCHFTANFLTATTQFHGAAHLPNPNDWGDLIFGTASTSPRVERSPLGTAVNSWSIPLARSAPTFDGKLKDWNAPFAAVEILPGLLGSRFGAKISMQYDTDNLYIAAHYKTSGPLQNMMVESTKQGFSGGDALQIRMSNGKGKPVNICGWFDSTAQKPALTIDQGDRATPFLLEVGAKEVFLPDSDNMGYTQQIAIPWKVLYPDQEPPKAGDRWKLTFQPWWSGLDHRFTFSGEVKLAKRGAINVAYKLPADGEVTLGLYDGTKLVSTILKSEFRNKGKVVDAWNGLDQWGQPVPAGSYQLKGIAHPHITTEYVMSLGNPGTPAWPTPDNKGDWLSDEEAPQAAATDGKWVFLAAPGSEKGYSIIAVDENGQRQWGTQEPFNPRTVSLAVEGDYVYALYSGPELTDASRHYQTGGKNAIGRAVLICLDKKTGQAAKFSLATPRLKIATWPFTGITTGLWELRSKMSFSPDNYAGQPRYYDQDIGETTNAIGIAALNHKLYVALHDENKLLVLNAETGEKLDEIPLPKPAGLHATSDGRLLAVSDRQVVEVDIAKKTYRPIISSGLVAPRCVTTDSKNQIYVSDWGTSFQVKVFTPTGTPLRTIGKAGGRPWSGPWDTSGMLVPTGLAVTNAGKLWVAEDDSAPKRTSVWNAETGAFLREYVGPTAYGGGRLIMDPTDASVAYAEGLRLKVDLASKTSTIQASIGRRMDFNQPFAFQGHMQLPMGKLVRHDGHEYLICNTSYNITIYQRKGELFLPVAAIGSRQKDQIKNGAQKCIWDSDLGYRFIDSWYPDFFKDHLGENYTWTDLNGDGLVQPEEMQWFKAAGRGDAYEKGGQPELAGYWGGSIGDDWSIYWPASCKDTVGVFRLDIKGWTPGGAPIYDIKDSVPIMLRDSKAGIMSVFAGSEEKVFVNYTWEFNKDRYMIECLDRGGKSQWGIPIPKEQGPKDIQCENVLAELSAPGLGKVLGTWAWHGNYLPYLITSDGLYVSSLLEPGRLGPEAAWDESFKGYYQDPKGVPYIINGANDAHHILKINGLKGDRFEAPFTLTAEDSARAATLRDLPVEKAAPQPIITVTSATQTPTIEGNLDEWNMGSGVKLEGDKGRTARIALSRDDTNLYLACEVNKESPFSNKGSDWQTLFISGDCVDLMLATNPKATLHRKDAVEGDERLLLSMYQGKPIAVLYRPVVPGTKTPIQLMAARLDEIKRLDSAKIGLQCKGNTYTLEASIPLKDLGIDPKETGDLQGDVGVVFSDETGGNRSQRLYHYNKKTSITADLTTEATLQPGEWGILEFPLGKNLLKNGGFNSGFSTKSEEGWFPQSEKNGARAMISTECPRSGSQSLILEQDEPVIFPSEAFTAPDFKTFITSANGGKGGGQVDVIQTIPVEAGHEYSFRFNYRTKGLVAEFQRPGPNRGYSRFLVDLSWIRPNYTIKDNKGYARVLDERINTHSWKQAFNCRSNDYSVIKPYEAPEGATGLTIGFHLNTLAANDLPKVYIDDIEFVKVK